MNRIFSSWTKLEIKQRPPRGYQYFAQPDCRRLKPIEIAVGQQAEFPLGDCIKNATHGGIYEVKTASDIDGNPIKDPLVSELLIVIPDKTKPTIRVDATKLDPSSIESSCLVYFQLIYESPNCKLYTNGYRYDSLWAAIRISRAS